MTWTRLDDSWTDSPRLEPLDFATRWHYLALIQFCCRNGRHEGLIRNVDARRASDHPNPAAANEALVGAGLLAVEGGAYRLINIDEHVPPPHVRNSTEQAKIRKRRERAHKAGDHALCLPDRCPHVTGDSHASVTRDIGSGQDGSGQAVTESVPPNVIEWATVTPGQGRTA